ncbi:MAG: hypothetical protein JWM76_4727 [Pseudonocardiales bacterium]|nr:hypothetical protein [Pseudonocardiales bacterium]
MNDADQTDSVTTAFRQAGLTPSESELVAFATAYAGIRSFLDSLYTLPGVRYESPALTFDPRKAYRDE